MTPILETSDLHHVCGGAYPQAAPRSSKQDICHSMVVLGAGGGAIGGGIVGHLVFRRPVVGALVSGVLGGVVAYRTSSECR